ncbi:conserved protein of unknown function [Rhodovastum atsumiense]|uniref:Magnetosome protein MamS/MamX domain-containing protein n=1 Tax=Rhodovastum atsumiense TaxID=504468 RepID=A0A5M6III7_9PROT|nr:hypothetical protein [Rhodovastum atsumiense]KAA5608024.1 hypothetical protein F1189_31090 [Rhodovastum atsumiense]CAH2598667.1 conserved protein of unknown function [Rhodovastum atsumiense]
MKAEKLVLLVGAALGIAVLLAAVIVSDDVLDDDPDFDPSGRLIAEAVGAGAGVGTPGLNAPQLPAEAAAGAQMQTVAMQGLVPFSTARTERFSGRVVEVNTLGSDIGWGQVHVQIVDEARRDTSLVSLAPTWFLLHLGCTVAPNDRISGLAFRFDAVGPDVPIYARSVSVNGRPCQLRSDEGIALWSNRLGQPR